MLYRYYSSYKFINYLLWMYIYNNNNVIVNIIIFCFTKL